MKNKNWWPPVFGMGLILYTAFTLLDAFVIPHDIVAVANIESMANSSSSESETTKSVVASESIKATKQDETSPPETAATTISEPIVTENSYISDTISINITTYTYNETKVYAADVVLIDASSLRTALAGGAFGRNVRDTTSNIAKDADAFLAINGDYYGFRDKGFVMRGGYLYRDISQGSGYEDLVIYDDGTLEIIDESQSDATTLLTEGAREIFSFGPGLIKDGEVAVTFSDEVEQHMRSNPRTAIGQIGPLHYLFVVSDGRSEESAGLTLTQLSDFMLDKGCVTAYNLDGGGSSTMYFMGDVINKPTTDGRHFGERGVSDIIYIGS